MIYDTHAHLQSSLFDHDIDEVIKRAEQSGIGKILNCATEPSDWESCRKLTETFPICAHAIGIHPWYVPENYRSVLNSITDSDFMNASAIGEIGLDQRFGKIPHDIQSDCFEQQVIIAKMKNLPIMIHCIGAWNTLFAVIDKLHFTRGGIIHNFNGSPELVNECVRRNLSISMGATLTYRDSQKRAKALKTAWPNHFLLETDSPDIPPREQSEKRNEPAFIIHALQAASEILEKSTEEIANQTSANAFHLFAEK